MQLSTVAIFVVAALHVAFFVLESLLWMHPRTNRVFGLNSDEAQGTRVLALNQGFYNLGAALLLLVFYAIDNAAGVIGMLLFLFAMGVVGGVTANWRIIVLQSLPALTAVLLFAWP